MARKKAPAAEAENHERWLLTYADLITLLLAFFVILYALANTDVKKFENLKGSLSKAFNVGVLSGQSSASLVSAGTINPPVQTESSSSAASNLRSRLEVQQQEGLYQDVIQFITQRQDGISVAVSSTATFVSGSAELTPEGATALRELATTFKELPNSIRIEGHTDSIQPGTVRYPTNWELSAARAVALVRYLESQGVPPQRLHAAGYGEQRPLAPNTTPRDRTVNRRAEIIILDPVLDAAPRGPALGPGIAPSVSTGGNL